MRARGKIIPQLTYPGPKRAMRVSINRLTLCSSLLFVLSSCADAPVGQPDNGLALPKNLPTNALGALDADSVAKQAPKLFAGFLKVLSQILEDNKKFATFKTPGLDMSQPLHFRVTKDFFDKIVGGANWAQAFQANQPTQGGLIPFAGQHERKKLFDFLAKLYKNGSINVVPDANDPNIIHVVVDAVNVEAGDAQKMAGMLGEFQKEANIKDEIEEDAGESDKELFIRSLVENIFRMIQSFEKGDKKFKFVTPKTYIDLIFQAKQNLNHFEQLVGEILRFISPKDETMSLDNLGVPHIKEIYQIADLILGQLLNAGIIELFQVTDDSVKVVIHFEKLRGHSGSESESNTESDSETEEEEAPKVVPKKPYYESSSSEEEVVVIENTKAEEPSPVAPAAASEKPPKENSAAFIGYSTLLLASSLFILVL